MALNISQLILSVQEAGIREVFGAEHHLKGVEASQECVLKIHRLYLGLQHVIGEYMIFSDFLLLVLLKFKFSELQREADKHKS